jgi:hypothetical protein
MARRTACAAQQRQIGIATMTFGDDNNGRYFKNHQYHPWQVNSERSGATDLRADLLEYGGGSSEIYYCPSWEANWSQRSSTFVQPDPGEFLYRSSGSGNYWSIGYVYLVGLLGPSTINNGQDFHVLPGTTHYDWPSVKRVTDSPTIAMAIDQHYSKPTSYGTTDIPYFTNHGPMGLPDGTNLLTHDGAVAWRPTEYSTAQFYSKADSPYSYYFW